jgi:hypothetical protein
MLRRIHSPHGHDPFLPAGVHHALAARAASSNTFIAIR